VRALTNWRANMAICPGMRIVGDQVTARCDDIGIEMTDFTGTIDRVL